MVYGLPAMTVAASVTSPLSSESKGAAAFERLLIHRSPNIDKIQTRRSAGSGTQANSSKTVKSVAFNVRSDETSAAR